MFIRKLIISLLCKKLGVKKFQAFQFVNQRSEFEHYWFTNYSLRKVREDGLCEDAHVSLNWLLNENCEIMLVDADELYLKDGICIR